jgi:hypothetical protein
LNSLLLNYPLDRAERFSAAWRVKPALSIALGERINPLLTTLNSGCFYLITTILPKLSDQQATHLIRHESLLLKA